MKVGLVGDVHVSDYPPRSRKDDYKNVILSKLEQSLDLLCETDCELIIFLGDIFHIQRGLGVTYGLIRDVRRILIKAGKKKKIYIHPGNHDLEGGNPNSYKNRPLGLLEDDNVVILTEFLRIPPFIISPLPQVYRGDVDKDLYNVEDLEEIKVKLVHSTLYYNKPIYEGKYQLLSEVWGCNWDILLAGHVHDGWGPIKKAGKMAYNPGSIARVSADDRREDIHVAVVDLKTQEVLEHSLSSFPADDVFVHLQSVDTLDEVGNYVDFLAESVNKGELITDLAEVFNGLVSNLNLKPAVEECIKNYVFTKT